jgi:hypothetical protein
MWPALRSAPPREHRSQEEIALTVNRPDAT